MAESGVIYTGPDDFLERVPILMARAGIAIKELPSPESGEDCERGFAFQFRRDKGTVELSGFYFIKRIDFIMEFRLGMQSVPLVLGCEIVWGRQRRLLMEAGMTRVTSDSGDAQGSRPADPTR